MTAKNMKELENMLKKEMRKVMEVSSQKMLADMEEETWDYYSGSTPAMYQRTGTLGDTPKVTAVSVDGNEVSFDAYLDTDFRYKTGKQPTMLDVLRLANNGITTSSVGKLRRTIGNRGFWERAEKKMGKTFNSTMRKFFK